MTKNHENQWKSLDIINLKTLSALILRYKTICLLKQGNEELGGTPHLLWLKKTPLLCDLVSELFITDAGEINWAHVEFR